LIPNNDIIGIYVMGGIRMARGTIRQVGEIALGNEFNGLSIRK
jgi:hypothetical protein